MSDEINSTVAEPTPVIDFTPSVIINNDNLEAAYELEDEANVELGRDNPPMSKKYQDAPGGQEEPPC